MANCWQGFAKAQIAPHITFLQDSSGTIKTSSQEINKVMLQYYTFLYALDPIDKNAAQNVLDKLFLPTVTSSQLEALKAPVSLLEISTTILQNPTKNSGAYTPQCL